MERPKPSTIGWAGLLTGVALYEWRCPPGETLSEGIDRVLETRYKRAIQVAVGITALHLVNGFEKLGIEQFDPIHHMTRFRKLGGEE